MAWVRVEYQIRSDEAISVDVGSEVDAPDMLTDLASRARALFRETLADVFDVVEREDQA